MSGDVRPWMLVARYLLGEREITGASDSPTIVEMFALCGHAEVRDDETAWCAAFVGACLALAGHSGTQSLKARSYLKTGRPLTRPEPGCIVVLWRESIEGGKGHVGFFDHAAGGRVFLLGGNQSGAVNIQGYPEARVLGYRWPAERTPIATSLLIPNSAELDPGTGEVLRLDFPQLPPIPDQQERDGIDSDDRGSLGSDIGCDCASDEPADSVWSQFEGTALTLGASGERVKDLQRMLAAKGFPLGAIDGQFGPLTEAAVAEFQAANRLEVNGVADMATLAHLLGGSGVDLPPARRQMDEASLLKAGSQILDYARKGKWSAAIAAGLAAFGILDVGLGASAGLGNAINAAAGAAPTQTGSGTALGQLLPTLVGTKGGLWALLAAAGVAAWRYFGAAAEKRVDDHRTGRNIGR